MYVTCHFPDTSVVLSLLTVCFQADKEQRAMLYDAVSLKEVWQIYPLTLDRSVAISSLFVDVKLDQRLFGCCKHTLRFGIDDWTTHALLVTEW